MPLRDPFMFATGIENSYPTINGGRTRVDEMEKCGHYTHWKLDFQRVSELGIRFLRYGPALHQTFVDRHRFDWSFSDAALGEIKARGIVPIVDLCHFGVPDWIGTFQNKDFPELFAGYARAFAQRYPHIQLYTPVNEMMICALFSASLGWWNEQLSDDRSFVTALKHVVKANLLAMHEILAVRPDAIFIQSESSEYYHAVCPSVLDQASFLNERRFLAFDLNYGKDVTARMYQYLMDNGMTKDDYRFFQKHAVPSHCVMGNDYYNTNEHRVLANGEICYCGEVFGYGEITQQYFTRYRLPVMHTETNYAQGASGTNAVDWLWKQWANILCVREHGVPILGFTWYSLTDQVDWDSALREGNGRVNELGLFDLDRNIRPVGLAYKELIATWTGNIPEQNMALGMPVISYETSAPAVQ
ncbi:family 1 glycosylhydrolase [Noviherbaspirillum soli]|uniref:family 1 glycosylhydrolase n=1 Tax=Noviherbaspirillum soli TaxID=1064518 RepID=UPI00188CF9DB|nr:family 1 glycosylhydrolase [Noviherbaspirillum soli]